MRERAEKLAGGILLVAAVLVGCGSDDDSSATNTDTEAAPTQNACPVDGCEVTIDTVEADGDELKLTWSANFAPDFSKNHIHVYWDTYSVGQVSSDATANGLEQGVWVPTDAYPTYTTDEVISTASREGSTTLCVTTSDGDHNVIDKDLVNCVDVSSHL
jgi:hypothetical protein